MRIYIYETNEKGNESLRQRKRSQSSIVDLRYQVIWLRHLGNEGLNRTRKSSRLIIGSTPFSGPKIDVQYRYAPGSTFHQKINPEDGTKGGCLGRDFVINL